MSETQSIESNLIGRPRWYKSPAVWGIASLVVLAFWATFSAIWNFDIFGHIACGEWMFEHGKVMGFDYFSIDPDPQWINVHWGFQLLVAAVYKLAGWGGLCYLKAILAVLMMAAFGLGLRKYVPTAWLVFCGVAAIYVMQSRLRIRPELFTLGFLILTLVLTENVRRGGSPRKLWWMVPVMIAWVNIHGLYFLGLVVLWSMMLGAWLDRYLWKTLLKSDRDTWGNLVSVETLAPVLAATVACLLSPWPVEALLHPLTLSTRLSNEAYVHGVSELRRTWEVFGYVVEPIVLFFLTFVAMVANARRLPLGHAVIFAFFTVLALMAWRNVGLFGPVAGVLLAIHGGDILRHLGQWRPVLRKAGAPFVPISCAVALLLAAGYATGAIPALQGHGAVPRAGFQADSLSVDMAKFLDALPAEGDVLCENFGDAGPFYYYANHGRPTPKRLVYMDGRLEAHSLERFKDLNRIRDDLANPLFAEDTKLPPSVRFIVVRHDSESKLSALMQTDRFRLLYIDIAGACFERMDWFSPTGKAETAKLPSEPNFAQLDVPLGRDGMLVGVDRMTRHWYLQNPPAVNYQYGAMLLALGMQPPKAPSNSATPDQSKCILLAIRYLNAALADGIKPHDPVLGALAQAYQQRAWQRFCPPSDEVPVDPNSARALYLYRQMDVSKLDLDTRKAYCSQWIWALVQAGQLDEADETMGRLLADFDSPPADLKELHRMTQMKVKETRQAAAEQNLYALEPLARARALSAVKYSLVNDAIAVLRSTSPLSPQGQLLLGDLLLRQGRTDDARAAYARVELPAQRQWARTMRLALCDWVDGKFFDASDALKTLVSKGPVVLYYLVELSDQIGDHATADRYRNDPQLLEFTHAVEPPPAPKTKQPRS